MRYTNTHNNKHAGMCKGFLKTLAVVTMVLGSFVAPVAMAEAPKATMASTSAASEAAWSNQISINTADAATLAEALDGIGESKAQAIVEWREANGEFASVDELTQVKGIGQVTLEKNRDRLSL